MDKPTIKREIKPGLHEYTIEPDAANALPFSEEIAAIMLENASSEDVREIYRHAIADMEQRLKLRENGNGHHNGHKAAVSTAQADDRPMDET